MPNASEDVADVAEAFTRLALKSSEDGLFPSLQLPDEVILDIIELLQEAYVAREERTEPHSLINLRL
jgi:hypothetical protein